jgi:Ca2+-binding EF-hand superfamily protein
MNRPYNLKNAVSCSSPKLTPKEIEEFQEAFDFFDTHKQGSVEATDVGKIMRAVGLNPSESELDTIVRSTNSKIDFDEFLNLASKNLADNRVDEQQIREAFKIFDSFGNGLLNLNQMRVSLQNLGESLRDEEVDELIREADIDAEGNVNYEELVKILCRN